MEIYTRAIVKSEIYPEMSNWRKNMALMRRN